MATCTHLLAVSCGFERFIHIWCLASETTLEGAEVDRCGRHRQHAAGTPGFTVLAAQHLPPPDDRRRRLAVCFVPCFRLPRHSDVQERTVSHSLYPRGMARHECQRPERTHMPLWPIGASSQLVRPLAAKLTGNGRLWAVRLLRKAKLTRCKRSGGSLHQVAGIWHGRPDVVAWSTMRCLQRARQGIAEFLHQMHRECSTRQS
jgi:hypothetical protein